MILMRNALAATPPGGTLSLRTYAGEDDIVVAVKDSGPGLAAEEHDTAFEPQFVVRDGRVQATWGLFVARSIARRHGGDIALESAAGRGSTFTIRLPRVLEPGQSELQN